MYRLGFNHGYYGYGDSYTTPIIDGVTLKENPYDAFLGGRFTKVPILTDNNMYEGTAHNCVLSAIEKQTNVARRPDLHKLQYSFLIGRPIGFIAFLG